jgi:uncharacterized protein (TIGR03083 family)
MQPLGPIHTLDLFPDERAELIALLESLPAETWAAPTACAWWSVKDVAAHLVADDLGVVSGWRDGCTASRIEVESHEALVAAINAQNEQWVAAMRRLSPRVIIELLRFVGDRLTAHFRSLDLTAQGGAVSWAGPEPAPVWFDVAREYTERWAHQAQIREGAGRPPLASRRLLAPVLDCYARALPHTFRDTTAAEGTHVLLIIEGEAGGAWSLVRVGGHWGLYAGVEMPPSATVTLLQDAAWRLFTKGMKPEEARGAGPVSTNV